MDDTFSTIDLATCCLLDSERTEAFGKAISQIVKPGDVVLDVGSGPGIMALFAAKAGAKKVYAVEYDEYTAEVAKKVVADNGFNDVIYVALADARSLTIEEDIVFDVVIMEMLTTGMVDEHQVWAANNLFKKGYANERTRFVPYKQDTLVTLGETDFNNYGFEMRIVKHVWKSLMQQRKKPLSQKVLLNSIIFDRVNELNSNTEHIIEISEDGNLNSIYLESETWLGEGLRIGDTLALNAPVIYPLPYDLKVKAGDKIKLKVDYMFGNGYRNLHVSASKS